ncbi:MAG TPA: dihydrolipoyl dehydrogenase [Candidatus Dormibacteraeota bacterium]|nr:dihydrolipoyl dehydrogenase [Candidatus Dormibacteraeota bacterium]
MPERFDVAVIGGGPGGYVAAIRAAQLGARTMIVEKDRLGGTCLVRGCIPTKAMLQSSELYSIMRRGRDFGVVADRLRFDLRAASKRRDHVVDQLVTGVEGLMKANGIRVLSGTARLAGGTAFTVGGERYEAGNVVLATGSVPSRIPLKGVEHTIDSDGILGLADVPETMVVIGGGVVGMEWGALYAALGTRVTVLELLPQVLPMVEADMVTLYQRHFEKLGGVIHTEARVEEVARLGDGSGPFEVRFRAGGEQRTAPAQVVLLATGRVPYTHGLGLEAAGVETERGRVVVDDHLRTSQAGVWAIGDVIGGIMLAHVASYEGVCAVENFCGYADRVPDYHAAPNCIYTDPEIANVGLGEEEARRRGHQVKVGRFPFSASGRALTLGQTEGAVKVVADARDDTLLGVQMVGPRVTDVIAEATLAVQQRLRLHDLDLTMHAHPTLAESLLEAVLAADGRAVHARNRAARPPAAAQPAPPAAAAEAPVHTSHAGAGSPAASKESPVTRSVEDKPRTAAAAAPQASTTAVDAARVELSKEFHDELLRLYRQMFLIRRFEERAQVEYTKARIGGYCHLNLGEEATVVGGIAALRARDYVYTSYREHGHAIARGVDPTAVMAELFGKETGVSHGRGGSMHIFDLGRRFMGGYGIVGGHLPLAVGAGFAIKYQKAEDIVFCMFGDGATNIGAFHESLNFAKVFELPVVWFCVNNQYGMGTAVERASAVAELYRKACAYDMESIRVDGMDLLEVMHRTAEMVGKTRQDSQPRFIEAVNYRFKGHSVVDPDRYRPEAEKERWHHSDPVIRFEHQLTEAGIVSAGDVSAIQAEVEAEVEAAVRFADESPNPDVGELYRYLYAGEWEMYGNA